MNNERKYTGDVLGLIIAFDFPAVALIYFDWKAALLVFLLGQFIIGFAKMLSRASSTSLPYWSATGRLITSRPLKSA